jgi:hypothetical protein
MESKPQRCPLSMKMHGGPRDQELLIAAGITTIVVHVLVILSELRLQKQESQNFGLALWKSTEEL